MKKILVDLERIKRDMDYINSITATEGEGCTRLSYSKEDRKTRDYILSELDKLGVNYKIDGVGNIRAKYPANLNESSILTGSHIDTVPNGGRFDGLTGSICALESMRRIVEENVTLKKPIEFIIYAEEEGSNFGSTTLGSKLLAGKVGVDELDRLTASDGRTARKVMEDFGLSISTIERDRLKKGEAYAVIELHVEQGAVLDRENLEIGVVNAISGMNTFEVTINGVANHAGATPMIYRKDPLAAAAEIILEIERFAKENVNPTTVATVGKLNCYPCASNVINGKVIFNVDIRDIDQNGIDKTSDHLKEVLERVKKERNIDYSIELVGSSKSVTLDDEIVSTIKEKVDEFNYKNKIMHSGAVHDCMILSDLCKVGMIFVPSKDGISHNPNEDTDFADIEKGANVLLATLIALAN